MDNNSNNKLNDGLLIVLEGGDGVGKTSMASKLYDYYTDLGYETVCFREPGSTCAAQAIREIILNNNINKITELLLYMAARNENYLNNIKPAIEAHAIVILDRFITSTYVYQGNMDGIDIATINNLNNLVLPGIDDINAVEILLDCPVEVSIERIKARGTHNKYDDQSIEYMKKLRNSYFDIFNKYIEGSMDYGNVAIVDASKDEDNVFSDIIKITNNFIKSCKEEGLI